VRDSHAAMEGVAVGIDENFEVGGEALFLPSDPDASLDETANCRCTVEYEVAEAGAESGFGGPRSEDVAKALVRLREKYGMVLDDTYPTLTEEQSRTLYGRRLTDTELLQNVDDLEAEMDAMIARGEA